MLTPKEIRNNYRNFDNWKIKELGRDAGTLRKDIIPILNEEIIRRNLGEDLLIWVGLESNILVGLERENLIRTIRNEKCTECLAQGHLGGYEFTTIVSYFIGFDIKTERLIICKSCANAKRRDSITKTLLLGWWSKNGLLSTPIELVSALMRMWRHEKEDQEILALFIDGRTGKIRQSLERNKLFASIKRFNTMNTQYEDE